MPEPAALIAVARLLVADTVPPPSDAQLRRAVSTAYYALFHKIPRAAAARFVGPGQENSAAYTLIYRSFDHRHIKIICEKLAAPTLNQLIRRQLRRDAISQDIKDFASAFPALQDARHAADYDPTVLFERSDVFNKIEAAEQAIAAFDRAEPAEQVDILALLMVKPRA